MPRCDCAGGGTCSCLVQGGPNITVTGAGSATNPYVVTSTATLAGALVTVDTDTVDMHAVGSGTTDDPYVVSADAAISVEGLTDVDASDLAVGDVLVWDGDTWVTAPPPVAPAGAVNVGAGLSGDGSAATPIKAATSGTWGVAPLAGLGSDSLVGQPIYVDSNGQLRAAPLDTSALHVQWANVDGKPATFPTTWSQVAAKPTTFPASWTTVTGRPKILTGGLDMQGKKGQTVTAKVTFPSGYFPSNPAVFAQAHSSHPELCTVSVLSGDKTYFTVTMYTEDNASRYVGWFAILNPAAS